MDGERIFQKLGIEYEGYKNDVADSVHIVIGICFVLFGSLFYKKVEGIELRKWIGTVLGVLTMCYIMGWHFIHLFIAVIGGAFLIKITGKRKCHLIALAYMMAYSTIFRICIHNEDRKNYTFMGLVVMMATVKICGVAFEIYNSQENVKKLYESEDPLPVDPSFSDLLHYTFSFFGAIFGPYVRYRTYDDFIRLPFAKCSNNDEYKKKLMLMPFYVIMFALFQNNWPLEYAISDEFRTRSLLYKLTFAVLQFQKFRFWMYCGLVLSECICIASGFGAYPVEGHNKSAHGPSKNYTKLVQTSYEEAKELEYDFKTISNVNPRYIQFSPWITKYTMEWNKCIQYFMGVYVYRSIPKTKILGPLRPFLTIIFCALWHGIDFGYQSSMLMLPMYAPTEKIFLDIHERIGGIKKKVLSLVMYVIQFYIIGFGTMSFLLLDLDKIIIYQSSVMYLPYFFIMIMHLSGFLILSIINNKIKTY